ncbi:MAG: prolipoprotein diacylglyceryl transferase [Bacteroidaceae bacterium]|nr:prolipoprotein diacylglyceryl transferase [Bacteroidaceae bacterium]
MKTMLNYIIWNPDKVLFTLGSFEVRWYGLLWCIGLAAAYFIVQWIYRREKIGQDKFEPLFIYCFVGIILGARLGHCLFYEPAYFLSHPIEMFLPIRQLADGSWKLTGYAGLASHGGTAGIILALWLYVRRYKMPILTVVDIIGIATPITACAIRLGNLMNSEIVGKATESAMGFIFVQNGEDFARYPAQLYEALAYLLLLFIGLAFYLKSRYRIGTGFYFGLCLSYIFIFRFFIEFLKEVQEQWELNMVDAIGLNQGQMLSLPFALVGCYFLYKSIRKQKIS